MPVLQPNEQCLLNVEVYLPTETGEQEFTIMFYLEEALHEQPKRIGDIMQACITIKDPFDQEVPQPEPVGQGECGQSESV